MTDFETQMVETSRDEVRGISRREAAREVFQEWAESIGKRRRAGLVHIQNDVATFHFETGPARHGEGPPSKPPFDARDFIGRYSQPGRAPLRVIDVKGVGPGTVEVAVVMAELKHTDNGVVRND